MILSTGHNKYLPFGTDNHGTKNVFDYLIITGKNDAIKEKINNLKIQQRDKYQSIQKSLDTHHQNIENHRKSIEIIEGEIRKLNKHTEHNIEFEKRMQYFFGLSELSPLERLIGIIDSEYNVYYYPRFIFDNVTAEVDQLTEAYKLKLFDKLKIVNRSFLKDLKEYVAQSLRS